MKHYLYISISFGLWLLTVPAQAAPPSADDFLPPVQASTPEQQQHLGPHQLRGPGASCDSSATSNGSANRSRCVACDDVEASWRRICSLSH